MNAVNKLPFLQIIQWQYGKIVVIYNVMRKRWYTESTCHIIFNNRDGRGRESIQEGDMMIDMSMIKVTVSCNVRVGVYII